jgi:hypothetical protein
MGGRLAESIDLEVLADSLDFYSKTTYALDIVQCMQLWAETTMYAKELLVHDGSKGQCAERVHTSIIYSLRIFVLAFELECEIVGQMATFVVASEQPESIWIPDLEGPEVQHALASQYGTQTR